MTVVHEPSLKLLQLSPHLAPLLCPSLGCRSLLFGEVAVLSSSLCEPRPALLGPWSSARPSMQLTAAHREPSGTFARSAAAGLSFAPLPSPVWAIEPRFEVSFHSAQLSSVYGVL